MHRHGLDEAVSIAGTSYSEEGGYQAGRKLLDRPDRPTAIFAGADISALGVLRAAYELGLRIPADLSLVGYDNTTLASSAPINLTSVDQAAHDLGATAARLLGRAHGRPQPLRSHLRRASADRPQHHRAAAFLTGSLFRVPVPGDRQRGLTSEEIPRKLGHVHGKSSLNRYSHVVG